MITLQCVTEPELEVNPLVQYHPKSQNSGMEVCQENSRQCYCLHGYNPHTFYDVSNSFFILLSRPMSPTFEKWPNQTLQQLQGINLSSAFFPSNMKCTLKYFLNNIGQDIFLSLLNPADTEVSTIYCLFSFSYSFL